MRYDNGLRNPSIVRYFQQPVVPVLCIGIPAFVQMKRVLSPTFYTKALVAIFFSRLVTDASNEIIKDKLKKRKRITQRSILIIIFQQVQSEHRTIPRNFITNIHHERYFHSR